MTSLQSTSGGPFPRPVPAGTFRHRYRSLSGRTAQGLVPAGPVDIGKVLVGEGYGEK